MDILKWILHIDVLLPQLLAQYPNGFLGIITGIVFLETGVVFLPFLPGDSLLFAAGALISQVHLSFWLFWVFLISAAILGDTLNYKIGQYFGQWLLSKRWVNPAYIDKAQDYFKHKGGRAVFLARFIPIMRTVVPFVAGLSSMPYSSFLKLNVIGALCWVTVFLTAGYWFGALPWVKGHFSMVVVGIIAVSLIPLAVDVFRAFAPAFFNKAKR